MCKEFSRLSRGLEWSIHWTGVLEYGEMPNVFQGAPYYNFKWNWWKCLAIFLKRMAVFYYEQERKKAVIARHIHATSSNELFLLRLILTGKMNIKKTQVHCCK